MKRLPKVHAAAVSDAERLGLAAWLAEWRLDLALRGEAESSPQERSTYPQREDRMPRVVPTNVTIGQILLMHPFSSLPAERPRYVAVLAEQSGGCLIAPFGRFARPALPGELATGRAAPALRVLCLWNAASIPERLLDRSWAVDRLTKPERSAALSLHRSIRDGQPPTTSLASKVGPALQHPLDPRWDYMEEERDWLSHLRLRAVPSSEERPLRLAAERRAKYGSRKPRQK